MQEVRVAAYRRKMHRRKSGPGIAVVRGEFGKLTRGELTRFYCNVYMYMYIADNFVADSTVLSCLLKLRKNAKF